MAKKPGTNPKGEFAFFNIVYEDDSQRSNRRVPSELLGGLDGDEPRAATSWSRTARSPRNPAARRWRSGTSAGCAKKK